MRYLGFILRTKEGQHEGLISNHLFVPVCVFYWIYCLLTYCIGRYLVLHVKHLKQLTLSYHKIFIAWNLIHWYKGKKRDVQLSRPSKSKIVSSAIIDHNGYFLDLHFLDCFLIRLWYAAVPGLGKILSFKMTHVNYC